MLEGPSVTTSEALAVRGDVIVRRTEQIAVEEPMEIRVEGPGQAALRVAVTMRTPGHDLELAVGFLRTEGLIGDRGDLGARPVKELPLMEGAGNVVTVLLAREFDGSRLQRNFYATSSCGICGKASLDQIEVVAPVIATGQRVGRSVLERLPPALRGAQAVFERTGGLHATGLFDGGGELLLVREDVGRHNAMDKVVGRMLLDGRLPLSGCVALVSGRASFEIVQKVAMAGIPILCAVSAPSSLAIAAAERLGVTLVGFLRGDGFNVYTRGERVDLDG